MKKIAIAITALLVMTLLGCINQTGANSDSETYIESVDEYKQFNAMKLVDKETGCKYLFTRNFSSSHSTMTQMLDVNGKPLCNS